ncbi:hypothetical protein [Nitrogeniibacter aestuarii]|uniref:hypothetical protein n=1 Tax=Nitrogeniibacter aestuarii TaxID=2815343 RepID=UPI001D1281D5|nr:hypothetical protein [Nitrogeniibacter aestuarii]
MLSPSTVRIVLLCATITVIVVFAPWLAAQTDPAEPGLFNQLCTSLGIIDAPPEPAPPAHMHH